jgi:hypothetical protein
MAAKKSSRAKSARTGSKAKAKKKTSVRKARKSPRELALPGVTPGSKGPLGEGFSW